MPENDANVCRNARWLCIDAKCRDEINRVSTDIINVNMIEFYDFDDSELLFNIIMKKICRDCSIFAPYQRRTKSNTHFLIPIYIMSRTSP